MRIALVSHILPPSGSGQAMMIYRMLQHLDPASYCLVSPARYDAGDAGRNHSGRLPGNYHHLPAPSELRRGHRLGLRHLRQGFNIPAAVRQHGRRIEEVVRAEGCGAVVACTGQVALLPAAHRAARRAAVPFYAYLFDHYSYREWDDPAARFWARRFEPGLMRGADGLIAPNEVLRDELRERFGVEAAVIHNSLDLAPYEAGAEGEPPRPSSERDGQIKIVYTGDVYEAHYDAFRNLIAALEALGRDDVRLHLYTDHPSEDLERRGIRGPVVRHPHHAMSEMPRVQTEADLLFLPLAFRSPYPELVRTSSTTKLGEYLAARRPVLAHAPRGSFVSWYCSRHECGLVVDESDPGQLAEAIRRALDDEGLRRRLGATAWERARADFDIRRARAAFGRLVGLGGEGEP